ncbi:DeoR family transcriptional regulator [Streptomyces sp. C]|nr:DeoR family transcriptional regulator [Streptomyces sp. C]
MTGGTTTTEVARDQAARPDLNGPASGPPALTVVTNALNIAGELVIRPQFKIVLTGGVARPQSYELTGPLAQRTLGMLSMDTAVLGVDAFDPADGAATRHEDEAAVNALLCERARRLVVAADSTKLGVRAFARICATSAVDVLVTDTALSEAAARPFRDAGVEVVRV